MMIKYKDGSPCCNSCCGWCGQRYGSSACGFCGFCGFYSFRFFSSCVGLCAGGSVGGRIALSDSRKFCTDHCTVSHWFTRRVDSDYAVLYRSQQSHRSQRPHQPRLPIGRSYSAD